MVTRFTRLTSLNGVTSSLADSPCIGVCSTTQWGDDRCSGCGRTYTEVRDWHTLSETEKKLINIRNAGEKYQIRQLKVRNCVKRTETPSDAL